MPHEADKAEGRINRAPTYDQPQPQPERKGLVNRSFAEELGSLAQEASDVAIHLECSRIRHELKQRTKRTVSAAREVKELSERVRRGRFQSWMLASLLEIREEIKAECELDATGERVLVYRRAIQRWNALSRTLNRPPGRPRSKHLLVPQGLINSTPSRSAATKRKDRSNLASPVVGWVAGVKVREQMITDGLPDESVEGALSHIRREKLLNEVLQKRGKAKDVREFNQRHGLDPQLEGSFKKAVSRGLRRFLERKLTKR